MVNLSRYLSITWICGAIIWTLFSIRPNLNTNTHMHHKHSQALALTSTIPHSIPFTRVSFTQFNWYRMSTLKECTLQCTLWSFLFRLRVTSTERWFRWPMASLEIVRSCTRSPVIKNAKGLYDWFPSTRQHAVRLWLLQMLTQKVLLGFLGGISWQQSDCFYWPSHTADVMYIGLR